MDGNKNLIENEEWENARYFAQLVSKSNNNEMEKKLKHTRCMMR